MNPETVQAMRVLACVLGRHELDRQELMIYGSLPVHLLDALDDLQRGQNSINNPAA